MNYSFEYIDIILLAMIAGFIFLRLRGILGKKSGFEDKMSASFAHDFPSETSIKPLNEKTFDENAKKDFLSGAKIAYETIITSFSSGNLKGVKQLLDKKVYEQFDEAIKARNSSGQVSETTFIGISSAEIKNHENKKGFLEVTVSFVSEIISCVKDKDNKILSGDPKKIKKVFDTWTFSKQINSTNPNWLLVSTEA
ncbi:Tim44/TimA family putative adaptor protein [Candidatus Pelagibacter sp.]|nr:Tim44/TimA family putative adaptor protein [Candidatus Pelagibacter sp.]